MRESVKCSTLKCNCVLFVCDFWVTAGQKCDGFRYTFSGLESEQLFFPAFYPSKPCFLFVAFFVTVAKYMRAFACHDWFMAYNLLILFGSMENYDISNNIQHLLNNNLYHTTDESLWLNYMILKWRKYDRKNRNLLEDNNIILEKKFDHVQ